MTVYSPFHHIPFSIQPIHSYFVACFWLTCLLVCPSHLSISFAVWVACLVVSYVLFPFELNHWREPTHSISSLTARAIDFEPLMNLCLLMQTNLTASQLSYILINSSTYCLPCQSCTLCTTRLRMATLLPL